MKWGVSGEFKVFVLSELHTNKGSSICCVVLVKRLWRAVMAKCLQKHISTNWDSIVRQGLKFWKGKRLCYSLQACMRGLW
jgi:hypothetical protein